VKELRLQMYALRSRVNRLEVAVFRAVVAVGSAAMVLGCFVPFVTATEKADDGDDDSVGLLATVFGIGDSGDGPFSEEATMAAIVVVVFALAGHFEGRLNAFSPATLSFTIGGVATPVATALHPAGSRD
jgi:hypothetical protein